MKKDKLYPKDAVFHYPLSKEDSFKDSPMYNDKLVELFRRQIINLLDVVELRSQGEMLKVDSFSFLSEPKKIYVLFGRSDKPSAKVS